MGAMTDWLERPPEGRTLRFADQDGGWTAIDFATLAERAHRVAGRFASLGVGPDDIVPIAATTSPEFVAHFFGALLAGATPAPFQAPTAFRSRDAYLTHLGRLFALTDARVAAVGATPGLAGECTSRWGVRTVDGVNDGWPVATPAPFPRIALLQLTSGSTGLQRAVRVPVAGIEANHRNLTERWLSGDGVIASWLPMYHDMGLIGLLITCLGRQWDGWFLSPDQFVRDPGRWLECFGRHGATTTAVPSFGLEYVARRVRSHDLTTWDFSSWRSLIIGAERIDAGVLDAFCRLLGPHGFSGSAVLPAYGLAEATLAVAGRRRNRPVRKVMLGEGLPAVAPAAARPDQSVVLVSCGHPMPQTRVVVCDEAGTPVPEGVQGEIVVSGPVVTAGYLEPNGSTTTFDGTLATGDAGFLLDGEVYVLGRLGDGLKIRGRWLFAEDLEALVRDAGAVRDPCVLTGTLGGRDAVTVLVTHRYPPEVRGAVGDAVRRTAGDHVHVSVRPMPQGWPLRTTSGKPRRREMWRRLAADGVHPAFPAAHRTPS